MKFFILLSLKMKEKSKVYIFFCYIDLKADEGVSIIIIVEYKKNTLNTCLKENII